MAKIVILSGAGISAESGISTFRGSSGLWEKHKVEDICSADCLEWNYDKTIEFYDKIRVELKNKKPNIAHIKIAELKNEFKNDIAVITQNIDDLFEKAGLNKSDLIHLHGSLTEVKCQNKNCDFIQDIKYSKQNNFNNNLCLYCQSKLRPNVVFFGEAAPEYKNLYTQMEDCKLLVIIGTSGTVINTDNLAVHVEKSILNNLEPSKAIFDELYTKILYMPATKAISDIAREIRFTLRNL